MEISVFKLVWELFINGNVDKYFGLGFNSSGLRPAVIGSMVARVAVDDILILFENRKSLI